MKLNELVFSASSLCCVISEKLIRRLRKRDFIDTLVQMRIAICRSIMIKLFYVIQTVTYLENLRQLSCLIVSVLYTERSRLHDTKMIL